MVVLSFFVNMELDTQAKHCKNVEVELGKKSMVCIRVMSVAQNTVMSLSQLRLHC